MTTWGPPAPVTLTGRKVRLREAGAADRSRLAAFDRHAARDRPRQVGGYRHWGWHRAGPVGPGDDVHFAIEALPGGTLVGSISIVHADRASGRFSYGVGIGLQHRRCGYARDAVSVLLRFMFEQHGYRRCVISVHDGNSASLTLHRRLGFRDVGLLRDPELSRDGAEFLVLMSITAEQFARTHEMAAGARAPVRVGRGRHWRPRRGRHWPAGRLRRAASRLRS